MTLKNLFIFHSIVAIINGGSLVLMPETYLTMYGVSVSDMSTIFITQLLGAGLLTYCFVAWFAKDAEDSDARRAIVLAFFITLTIGGIIALLAQLANVMNALGWVTVGLYFLLALGYGYFQFMKPDAPSYG